MSSPLPEITLLSGMLGQDLPAALDRHRKLGLHLLDLKDGLFGKNFADLTPEEALAARKLIEERGLEVYTLSSSLCHEDVEQGEASFRAAVETQMKKVLAVAPMLRPRSVRLLSAWSSRRTEFADSAAHLDRHHPWIHGVYRDCIDRLTEAGYAVLIENEAHQDIFSNVAEVQGFFDRLDRDKRVRFTWDIQNFWQMGTFPSVTVYESLRPLIGYLHFKGGQAGPDGKLAWAGALEDASWPVADIAHRAMTDASIPVFCLNPSHGQHKPGYDYAGVTERDIRFLQQLTRKN